MKESTAGMSLITIAIVAALTAVLDMFAVISFPTGILSVSSFYIGSAFFLIFVYLFRWKGALGIYCGLLLSSVMTSGFSLFPLYGAWGNVVANVFIVAGMALVKCDCELKTRKDMIAMAVFFVIGPMISAAWVLSGWVVVGIIPAASFVPAFIPWWLGGVAVYFVVGTPVMKLLVPVLKHYAVF